MKLIGKTILAAAAFGAVIASVPASAQAWQYDTQRAARQQETAAAARTDYQIGEANAYGAPYPNRAPSSRTGYMAPMYWDGY